MQYPAKNCSSDAYINSEIRRKQFGAQLRHFVVILIAGKSRFLSLAVTDDDRQRSSGRRVSAVSHFQRVVQNLNDSVVDCLCKSYLCRSVTDLLDIEATNTQTNNPVSDVVATSVTLGGQC